MTFRRVFEARKEKILELRTMDDLSSQTICKVISCDTSQAIFTEILKQRPKNSLHEPFTRKVISSLEKLLYRKNRPCKNQLVVALAIYFTSNASQIKVAEACGIQASSLRKIRQTLHLTYKLPVMVDEVIHWVGKKGWLKVAANPREGVVFQPKAYYRLQKDGR